MTRERCRYCGRLGEYAEQLAIGGGSQLVAVRETACVSRPGICEAETRADRMARDTSKRISRRLGIRR